VAFDGINPASRAGGDAPKRITLPAGASFE
jgi:hypothetical protein